MAMMILVHAAACLRIKPYGSESPAMTQYLACSSLASQGQRQGQSWLLCTQQPLQSCSLEPLSVG